MKFDLRVDSGRPKVTLTKTDQKQSAIRCPVVPRTGTRGGHDAHGGRWIGCRAMDARQRPRKAMRRKVPEALAPGRRLFGTTCSWCCRRGDGIDGITQGRDRANPEGDRPACQWGWRAGSPGSDPGAVAIRNGFRNGSGCPGTGWDRLGGERCGKWTCDRPGGGRRRTDANLHGMRCRR